MTSRRCLQRDSGPWHRFLQPSSHGGPSSRLRSTRSTTMSIYSAMRSPSGLLRLARRRRCSTIPLLGFSTRISRVQSNRLWPPTITTTHMGTASITVTGGMVLGIHIPNTISRPMVCPTSCSILHLLLEIL
jgi:hypothetical protein